MAMELRVPIAPAATSSSHSHTARLAGRGCPERNMSGADRNSWPTDAASVTFAQCLRPSDRQTEEVNAVSAVEAGE